MLFRSDVLASSDDAELQQWLEFQTPLSRQLPQRTPSSGLRSSPSSHASRDSSHRSTTPTHVESSEGLVRTQWERLVLEPGVELHLQRPAAVSVNRRIQELLKFYRTLGR